MKSNIDIYCFSNEKFEIPKNLHPGVAYKFIDFYSRARLSREKIFLTDHLDPNKDVSFAFFNILENSDSFCRYCYKFKNYDPAKLTFLLTAYSFNSIFKFEKQIIPLVKLRTHRILMERVFDGKLNLNNYIESMNYILFTNERKRLRCNKAIETLKELHNTANDSILSQMKDQFFI